MICQSSGQLWRGGGGSSLLWPDYYCKIFQKHCCMCSKSYYYWFLSFLSLPPSVSYPLINRNRMTSFVQTYSTVGDRVPICLRKMLLKIWATSFFAYNKEGREYPSLQRLHNFHTEATLRNTQWHESSVGTGLSISTNNPQPKGKPSHCLASSQGSLPDLFSLTYAQKKNVYACIIKNLGMGHGNETTSARSCSPKKASCHTSCISAYLTCLSNVQNVIATHTHRTGLP